MNVELISGVELARKQMFLDFCVLLETKSIPYVILSGYQGYPDRIDSDVDFMVSESDFSKLTDIFSESDCIPGAKFVQLLQHETTACYYVFAKQVGAQIAFLHPDAAASYRRRGRLWLASSEVLASRRKSQNGFWIPSPAVEFEYYLVKRIDKKLVEARHLVALAQLMSEDKAGCMSVLSKYFDAHIAAQVETAIAANDAVWFAENKEKLQLALAKSMPSESIFRRTASRGANMLRMLRRILHPTGLVIAVMGPDGSGKTTIIEHLEKEIAPAFRKTKRFHLRPHFGKSNNASAPVTDPHAQLPRGWLASFLKTILFVLDYWFGWLRLVYPAKIRSTLVIFDRYYHDMLVDEVRYRLPRKFLPTRVLACLIPKPDIWLILDAPAEILVARKGEITLQAAQQLIAQYRDLENTLPNALLIETGAGLQETLTEVIRKLQNEMAVRATKNVEGKWL